MEQTIEVAASVCVWCSKVVCGGCCKVAGGGNLMKCRGWGTSRPREAVTRCL